MRLLILGGTAQASALAARIAERDDLSGVLSLAGRTQNPAAARLPMRVGGFGGAEGLRAWIAAERIDAVIDATHPFAAQISGNAAQACEAANMPLLIFTRPPWARQDGDRWIEVDAIEQAVPTLGEAPRRVFLTHGRLQLAAFASAPQHRYLVRAIERPEGIEALARHRLILARGPFNREDEAALMRDERIDIVVSKNSGGEATYAKIEAARSLGLTVVMVRRPASPAVAQTHSLDFALAWIEAHRAAP